MERGYSATGTGLCSTCDSTGEVVVSKYFNIGGRDTGDGRWKFVIDSNLSTLVRDTSQAGVKCTWCKNTTRLAQHVNLVCNECEEIVATGVDCCNNCGHQRWDIAPNSLKHVCHDCQGTRHGPCTHGCTETHDYCEHMTDDLNHKWHYTRL